MFLCGNDSTGHGVSIILHTCPTLTDTDNGSKFSSSVTSQRGCIAADMVYNK
ncbi:hypothetical protein C0J52_10027 [Blattella germanica]|nr:hypothetical protein C0J52_10027 [Blattella germanica]